MPPAGPDRDRPFELFVSYSHQSESVKDRLLVHLGVLKRQGLVSTWTDQAIPPGALWRQEIEAGIARADAAIFIVSADFLASGFCMDEELPDVPDRHAAAVMGSLDATLRDEHAVLDRALIRALGVFDRPAPWEAIQALKDQNPPIAGLTEPLHGATEAELEESLARLLQWGLADRGGARPTDAASSEAQADPAIEAHPLVREHFGRVLEQESPAGWRAARELSHRANVFISYAREDLPDRKEKLATALGLTIRRSPADAR